MLFATGATIFLFAVAFNWMWETFNLDRWKYAGPLALILCALWASGAVMMISSVLILLARVMP